MILSRISKAIREQNWFAVAIEFLIVILGVVIGFQVTAWNAQRMANDRAEVLTARLIEDMQAEQWRVIGVTTYYEQVADNAQRALDTLEGRRETDDRTLVVEAFRATQIFSFPVIRTTYEELVSTGTINLIADDALIAGAIEYYETGQDEISFQNPDRPYRYAFFALAERDLYDALADVCAEPRTLTIGDYDALPGLLLSPCEIEGHDEAFARIAQRLRTSDTIRPLLRQRTVEASIESRSQAYWLDLFRRILPPASE
ncbi:hypothetical protein L5876_08555 [Hyphobacterium sp. SN044]|uniref:hypothetical protein n=1 Tax=Hyphobacterium sp. SN044 TaxID=2912575 RepID=UPI001F212BE7|nr:hypothetical protein [Hyphobacterium sp. SN044]MCF8879861.1 hypothetical protein [Hyphobacterium sp. SN044]